MTWMSGVRSGRLGRGVGMWTMGLACGGALAWGGAVLRPMAARGDVRSGPQQVSALRIVKFVAPQPTAYHVVSALVVGPTEAILWDAQDKVSDGKHLAEAIATTGKHLKAIVLSHADHDHYMGAQEVLKRFPGTPVYMSRAGLDDFAERSQQDLAARRKRGGDEVPDSIVEPRLLPAGGLDVDGYALEVLDGLGGDVRGGKNAALWIPSIRAVLAGDVVFEGIHPWLGDSDMAAREEWRSSLRRLAALNPDMVVPGHKRDATTPDDPKQIDFMLRYLDDYDAFMHEAGAAEDLVEAMVEKYPELAIPGLMAFGARRWFKR